MSENGQKSTPQFVLSTEGELYGEDTPDNREIVRRIHACVSACEGISTDELEKGIIHDMQRVIGEVAPLLSAKVASRTPGSARRPMVVDAEPLAGT
jgi:hypothetical protein